MADGLKTVAFFLIAAGLFMMSFVIYDVMGKHDRYPKSLVTNMDCT
jgi:hypothetical protein